MNPEARQVIPDAAVEAATVYSCVTHGYATRVQADLVRHIDNNAGCKMRIDELKRGSSHDLA